MTKRGINILAVGSFLWLAARGGLVAAGDPAPRTGTGMGTIRAECGHFRLSLAGSGASREVVGENGTAAVPPGTYYVMQSEAEYPDTEGRTWRVRNGMAEKPIVVRAGETTPVTLGGPVEGRMTVHLQDGKLVAEAQFFGPLGERCEGIAVAGGVLPLPRVRILDESGRVLARPEGGYCCHFTATITWPVPADVKGRLRVVPDIAFGPVPIWSETSPTVEIVPGKGT